MPPSIPLLAAAGAGAIRFASKKAGGSTANGRDSNPECFGDKKVRWGTRATGAHHRATKGHEVASGGELRDRNGSHVVQLSRREGEVYEKQSERENHRKRGEIYGGGDLNFGNGEGS